MIRLLLVSCGRIHASSVIALLQFVIDVQEAGAVKMHGFTEWAGVNPRQLSLDLGWESLGIRFHSLAVEGCDVPGVIMTSFPKSVRIHLFRIDRNRCNFQVRSVGSRV